MSLLVWAYPFSRSTSELSCKSKELSVSALVGLRTNECSCRFFQRRKRYATVGGLAAPMVVEPYTGHNDYKDDVKGLSGTGANVSEIRG